MKNLIFKKYLIFALLFLSILVSYAYVLNGDFIGDDVDRINFNHQLGSYKEVITGILADRPLLMLYVATIYQAFGMNSTMFHFFSYVLHAFVAYQLFLLLTELIGKKLTNENKSVPVFMAFLFALHPLNSQAVTTSIQAGVLFSGIFGILSIRYFFKYLEAQSNTNFWLSIFFFLVGVLAKPNIFFIPFFFFFGFHMLYRIKEREWTFLGLTAAVLTIPMGYYFILGQNQQTHELNPIQYFLVQTQVVFTYFKLMILPYGLKFLYDFSVPKNIFWNWNLLYLLGHIVLFFGVYRKLPSKLTQLMWVGFYLTFLPESSFFSINHTAFEHRTYFSLIFLFLLLGLLISEKLNEVRKPIFQLVTSFILVIFVLVNQSRNLEIKRWGDWAVHTLQNSTQYTYTSFMLSFYLLRAGHFDEVGPILENYKKIGLVAHDMDILDDIFGYYKNPEKRAEYFTKFSDLMLKRELVPYSRFTLSKIFLDDFSNVENDLPKAADAAYVLAKQLRIYVRLQDQYFTSIFGFFVVANRLLVDEYRNEFKKYDMYKYVVVKLALYLYYNKEYPELGEELQAAIKNAKSEFDKEDLTFMYDQYEKKRKSLEKTI
ncbi:MAG: hypothetical protein JNL11_19075 [Bdellovibrionaceae bacterium]|nr:hypothetical protein [Pseudobdellovibrionaceae bacterium]